MMSNTFHKQQGGFVLIVAMIVLAVVSLFAIQGMGMAGMSERLAGNYTDRARAMAAAEQAIAQGEALLQANAVTCLSAGCNKTDNPTLLGFSATHTGTYAPSDWSTFAGDAVDVKKVSKEGANGGKLVITYLSDAKFAKTDCQPYNIMARGVGLNKDAVVVLQTITYLCATE
jgi:type IV pilus assembly protein PilX